MTNILNTIADHAKIRVEQKKRSIPLDEIRKKAASMFCDTDFPFEKALSGEDIAFICECKKASPSRGVLAEEYDYLQIAEEYENAGADCISVLTEPKWFLGDDIHLREITKLSSLPCLRKDFIVDEYMIYESKTLGASAVLLICSLLEAGKLKNFLVVCQSIGISALVEAHNEQEIFKALGAGARMIGINNRDLTDFTVNIDNSRKLRDLVPKDVLYISESGIRTAEDVDALREIGADAVLIGEALMRAPDKKAILRYLRGR